MGVTKKPPYMTNMGELIGPWSDKKGFWSEFGLFPSILIPAVQKLHHFVCSTQKTSLMGATKKPLDTYWGLKACVTCKTAPFMRKVQLQ